MDIMLRGKGSKMTLTVIPLKFFFGQIRSGAEAEKKCRESYDTNEEGKPHLQCAVSYRSETAFNCLSTTPCQVG